LDDSTAAEFCGVFEELLLLLSTLYGKELWRVLQSEKNIECCSKTPNGKELYYACYVMLCYSMLGRSCRRWLNRVIQEHPGSDFRNRRPMVLYIIVAPGHSLYVPLPLQQFVSL
jgi:hypothetical protein